MKRITEYLTNDHDRLDRLLQQSLTPSGEINNEAYQQFRQGLLRHIGIEEKILIPALKRNLDAEMQRTLDRIRLDHSAIVALLVPPPSLAIVQALTAILTGHNELEEKNGGFYERADAYDETAIEQIADKVKNAPEVKSLPNNPDPNVLEATRRALERAGYDPKKYLSV
ncbi:MAG: hemerythrin domain-containing protein [Bacteroidota bacterium]